MRGTATDGAQRRRAPRGIALGLLALGAAGCSSLHWPWHHEPPPLPTPVHVLGIAGPGATAVVAQYWERNTLVVDMSAASGSGSLTLTPAADGWPVRVALRVTPGSVSELDVRGAERQVLPIVPAGSRPVQVGIAPGVYAPKTPQITVSWGPAGAPAT